MNNLNELKRIIYEHEFLEKLKKLNKNIYLYLVCLCDYKFIGNIKNDFTALFENDKNEKIYVRIINPNKVVFIEVTDELNAKNTLLKLNDEGNIDAIYKNVIDIRKNGIILLDFCKDLNLKEIESRRYVFSNEKISKIYPNNNIDMNLFFKGSGLDILENAQIKDINPDIINILNLNLKNKKIKAYFNRANLSKIFDTYNKSEIFLQSESLNSFISKEIDSELLSVYEKSDIKKDEDLKVGPTLHL